jgi:hypothetical protein
MQYDIFELLRIRGCVGAGVREARHLAEGSLERAVAGEHDLRGCAPLLCNKGGDAAKLEGRWGIIVYQLRVGEGAVRECGRVRDRTDMAVARREKPITNTSPGGINGGRMRWA